MRRKPRYYRLCVLSTRREQQISSVSEGIFSALAAAMLTGVACQAQEEPTQPPIVHSAETYQLGHSPLNEPAAVAKEEQPVPVHFLVPLGAGGLNFSAGLKAVYVDNVFLTKDDTRDDFILVPECDVAGFFPVGQFNSINFDVGLAYYEYLRNTRLNTGTPLINPNTDLAFNLRSGDFRVKFSERFSYQENPVYDTGGEFFNLFNTALFSRYFNRVGALVTWDQNKLVMSAGYFHENLWSESSVFNYVDHSSEIFSADAMLSTSKELAVGLESAGSINDFDNRQDNNTWRARVGPVLRFTPSQFITVRMGAGYERIEYDSSNASALGLKPDNTFYAYADVEHTINQFLRHSLTVSHDNQLGFNAANLEGTSLSYSLSWSPRKHLTVSPLASINFYDESFGSATANLFHEEFTYYRFGLNAQYELSRHWHVNAGWTYRLKDSDTESHGYSQNEAFVEVGYQF